MFNLLDLDDDAIETICMYLPPDTVESLLCCNSLFGKIISENFWKLRCITDFPAIRLPITANWKRFYLEMWQRNVNSIDLSLIKVAPLVATHLSTGRQLSRNFYLPRGQKLNFCLFRSKYHIKRDKLLLSINPGVHGHLQIVSGYLDALYEGTYPGIIQISTSNKIKIPLIDVTTDTPLNRPSGEIKGTLTIHGIVRRGKNAPFFVLSFIGRQLQ